MVCLLVTFVSPAKNSWTDWDAVRGTDSRNRDVLDGVKISPR